MKKNFFYGNHFIDNNDIIAVSRALRGEKITQGNEVSRFENNLKLFFGSKYVSAVSSGTAALHLTMLSLNLKKNHRVITSPISFLASANCVEYLGSKVEFSDICPKTYNLDPEKIEDKLRRKKNIKAVIAIDYAGHPSYWSDLNYLKKKYNFFLINDNCHSLGSKYKNDIQYAVKYADIVTQSFHPVKHITTGEGGAVITNNKSIYKNVELYKNHGIERNLKDSKIFGRWFYKMNFLGYNYRISDINCALGSSQLSKVNKFIKKRRLIANWYFKFFEGNKNFQLPISNKNVYHSYHLFPLLINFKNSKISKKNFFIKLAQKNVFLQVHYIPIHLQPYYKKKYNFKIGDFPIAENFYRQEVSLPVSYNLNKQEIENLSKLIKNLLF